MPFHWPLPRGWRVSLIFGLFLSITFISAFVGILVFGVYSELDNLHPSIVRLLPAGHSICKSSPVFESETCLARIDKEGDENSQDLSHPTTWRYKYGRDDRNEGLSEDQCMLSFPGLFEDVHRAVTFRKTQLITSTELRNIKLSPGMARAMIFDGELYVVEVNCKHDRKKIIAILASIHRSISSIHNPRELPNIEFVFTIEDMADDPTIPTWVLARRVEDEKLWLMPDFGLWSWDRADLGPYDEVVSDVIADETTSMIPWAKKIPKLVWRGKLAFAPKIRRALLESTRNKDWADVAPVQWSSYKTANNFLSPIEQCGYQMIVHAEGRSYSGSLKYRQACNSVVISHKLQWIQHHHYLLTSHGPYQNFVEVERDFSDLEGKVEELLHDREKAELIAKNSIETFRERYLTRAAGACYWRSLIKGWAEASEGIKVELFVDDGKGGKSRRGLRWETFVFLPNDKQLIFP